MKRSSFLKALIAIPFGVSIVKYKEKSPYTGESIKHGSREYWINGVKVTPGYNRVSASCGVWIPGEDNDQSATLDFYTEPSHLKRSSCSA
jgi:hypothetical protein